ncbi:MAG: glycosyltransferase, partial [Patescibacteria group bacterium]
VIAAGIYPPHPGGPALHAKHYVEELPQMGIPTRLVAFSPLLGYPKGIRHGIYLWKLFWKALHSRAIFAQDISSAGYPAYLIARFLARPLFVRIGGDIAWESAAAVGGTQKSMLEWYASGEGVQSRLFPYGKKILGRAKRVMVPTELLRHVYRDYYGVPDAKIVVIPNPVDATQTRELERATPPGEKRTLLFASRLVAYKNLPFVIGSIARIQGSVPSFRFVICGDGPEFEALGKLVADRHLEEVVELWGRVSESEVALLTEEAWCTIAPAFTEFNPNFVLRGLASGVPFLISAENGLPFRVPEQFLFNARNGEQLDERLRCILSDKGHADAEQLLRELPALDSWATFLSKVVTFLRTP